MADLIGQHLGNYEIISPLGQGGMATVYRARQTTMKRDVAIKVITQQHAGDTEFTKRFEREVETIASLSHAHILKVFDYGKHEGMVYLVMELLTGGSLADKISAGAIPPKKVKALLNQITSALDYAHRRGIIHRDLKPQNVMLDEGGNAFLTDFGIAKIVSSNQAATATKAGAIMGTPYYMAPEQWRGDPVDARTDIYALGTILYEMLLGRLPFDADTAFVLMHKHVNEPPPLAELREKFSVAVSHAVSTAMAKDPAQRYASAGDLAKAFEDALEGTFLSDTTSPPIVTLIDVPLERATGTMPTVGASTMGRASTVIGEGGGSTPSGTPTSLFKPGEEPQAKQRGWLIPALVGVVGVLVVVVAILALNRSATVSLTPTAAALAAATTDAPSITPSLTNTASATVTASPTDEPPPLTQAVLILTERVTQTANAVASFTKTPTPNLRATAVALVQQQDTATAEVATANAVASFTKTFTPTATFTPSPTLTFTATAIPTNTLTTTFTPTFTATPTNTFTATFTATATHTPTATPTVTNTPSPTFTLTATNTPNFATKIAEGVAANAPCTVTAKGFDAKVRSRPNTQSTVVRVLRTQPVSVVEIFEENGERWWRVFYPDGETAWVDDREVILGETCGIVYTPTPTPITPTMTPTPFCTVSTTDISVQVRAGPSLRRSAIRIMPQNDPVAADMLIDAEDGTRWWRVTALGAVGYVLFDEVTADPRCVVVPTPTPAR